MLRAGLGNTNLIGIFTDEGQHPADVLHALHLGAEGGLGVEVTLDEVAVLAGSQLAPAVDPDAAGPGSDLALDVVRPTLQRTNWILKIQFKSLLRAKNVTLKVILTIGSSGMARQMGHLLTSSGHWTGCTDAGELQKRGSWPTKKVN